MGTSRSRLGFVTAVLEQSSPGSGGSPLDVVESTPVPVSDFVTGSPAHGIWSFASLELCLSIFPRSSVLSELHSKLLCSQGCAELYFSVPLPPCRGGPYLSF